MTKRAPRSDVGDENLEVSAPKKSAVGLKAVLNSLAISNNQMGARRTFLTLSQVNQKGGFDCPGCAWPDPDHRSQAEFCENGAKAVAEEATLRRVGPEFFAEHSLTSLRERSEHWLGQQGRLTQPVYRAAGSDHYVPVTWNRAFSIVAGHLRRLPSPDQAAFYTSGRTSNEAAFVYQLMVRRFGTNNLPDCSNMCHESSGTALNHTIGIGKGSVLLDDLYQADLILVVGQNPGTNHPRMLTALEKAKRNGAYVVAVNPLPEAGLGTFHNPQSPVGMARGTKLADEHLAIRLAGDQALFAAIGKLTLEAGAVDQVFIDVHTSEFEEYASFVASLSWDDILTATGLTREEISSLASRYMASQRVVVCWAMGLTQHRDSVATIQEIVNVLLLRGNIGKPGAGVCPVRGHSNVQGDRTMGIWEKMPDPWLDRLGAEFGFEPPRKHGYDTVDTIRAMRAGDVRVFFGMGGNFVSATPDTAATEEAMASMDLTVQVSTKLNRSHVVAGREALILPCLGRTEHDAAGDVTVEDSMGMVHLSHGRLKPASHHLLSETAIVCGVARALFPGDDLDWAALATDYRLVRQHIAAVVPGFEDFERKVAVPGGFVLPNAPRDSREFATETGKARFTRNSLDVLEIPDGHLLLQTLRSHDQFNTTIYGLDDRYRGIKQGRRVVFVNPTDLTSLGLSDGDLVDLVGPGDRVAPEFRVVAYPTARGCAAAYYPETNVLVPLDAVAKRSNTPVSKSVLVRLQAR
ncbi:MAG TPA: FdhF/YdeP family oxidoreductase [Nocardioidaceae bacterium]|nr:FdhF/YdeP family oxidoreductase [Nocardioidaceae bacterium]